MSAARREATTQSSSNDEPSEGTRRRLPRPPRPTLPGVRIPTVALLRSVLALAALAGCVLLVLATTATVIEIRVLTTSEIAAPIDTTQDGWERHGPALLLLAGLAFVMLLGALRRARPAMLALGVSGLAALAIALVWDLPDLDDTGEVGVLYEGARAGAESGYYFETAGGALLLFAAVGFLALSGRGGGAPARRENAAEAEAEPADDAPGEQDWFRE